LIPKSLFFPIKPTTSYSPIDVIISAT